MHAISLLSPVRLDDKTKKAIVHIMEIKTSTPIFFEGVYKNRHTSNENKAEFIQTDISASKLNKMERCICYALIHESILDPIKEKC